jgi:hypothetical protein
VVWFDFSFGFGLVCDGKLVGWAACTGAWWVGVDFGLVFRPLAGRALAVRGRFDRSSSPSEMARGGGAPTPVDRQERRALRRRRWRAMVAWWRRCRSFAGVANTMQRSAGRGNHVLRRPLPRKNGAPIGGLLERISSPRLLKTGIRASIGGPLTCTTSQVIQMSISRSGKASHGSPLQCPQITAPGLLSLHSTVETGFSQLFLPVKHELQP